MKKILYISILLIATLFLINSAFAAGTLSIGSQCEDNGDCKSNDCENSTKLDPQGKKLSFCDCGELDTSFINPSDSQDCVDAYGGVKDDWTCADGSNLTWDLDYCKNNSDIHKTQFPIPPDKGAASFIDTLLDSSAVTAQMYKEIDNIVQKPQPKITIPGLTFSEGKTIEDPTGKYLYIPFLGEYIAALYKYLIIAAGIIAVAMIINAAFGWVMSAGDSQKITHAKTRIGQALMGLFIAVASYFILNLINPELVEFRNLRVQYVETIPLAEDSLTIEEGAEQAAGKFAIPSTIICDNPTAPGSGLVPLQPSQGLKLPPKSTAYLNPEAAEAIKKAGAIAAQEGYLLHVTSACRPLAVQAKKAAENPAGVAAGTIASVGNSPHGFGIAVDIRLMKDGEILVPSGDSAHQCQINPAYVKKLSEIMYAAGFYRLGIENWHYELPPKNSYCRVKNKYDPAPCRVGSSKVPCITK
ncbi:MAG: D-alanyl-D-alanine carboxypeptidase family protein [Candidatus Magasanikbacteria bacterium]|nr:D-alanyl-D-alanine carboxypeptidase family protein [Candidatus Magasanikbacteria bacterium]